MFSLTNKRDQKGFTIVELLIVIVVIGILAALVVTTYAGIQAKARDSKRQTDIQALQTQIEAYYATANNYPSLTQINETGTNTGWRKANMKSLDAGALTDPSSTSTVLIATTPTASSKAYQYAPTNDAGTSCESDATSCTQYTLAAWLEGSKAIYKKANLD